MTHAGDDYPGTLQHQALLRAIPRLAGGNREDAVARADRFIEKNRYPELTSIGICTQLRSPSLRAAGDARRWAVARATERERRSP